MTGSMKLRRFGGNRKKRGKNKKRKLRAENKEKHWDFIKLCKQTINARDGEWMQRKESEIKRVKEKDELDKKE